MAAEVVINDHQRWFDGAVADSPRFCVVYFDTLVLLPRGYTTFPMSNHKAVKAASGLFSYSCSHFVQPKNSVRGQPKTYLSAGREVSSICMYLHVVLWLHVRPSCHEGRS